ncbi:hypothetical protein VTI74DRAFT_9601 [Chaetomium olivicolor]
MSSSKKAILRKKSKSYAETAATVPPSSPKKAESEPPTPPGPADAPSSTDETDARSTVAAEDTNPESEPETAPETEPEDPQATPIEEWKKEHNTLLYYTSKPDLYIRGPWKDGRPIYYAVTSRYLTDASQVFESAVRFARPERTSSGRTKLLLDLTDSKHSERAGLDMVFCLLHHQYYEIDSHLTIGELYEVARTVEYYDCPHIVHTHMTTWCGPFSEQTKHGAHRADMIAGWGTSTGRFAWVGSRATSTRRCTLLGCLAWARALLACFPRSPSRPPWTKRAFCLTAAASPGRKGVSPTISSVSVITLPVLLKTG